MIDHLPCYQHVLKEAHRYGSKWSKPWAQEQALQLVSSQLPALLHAHTHVVSHTLYPTWTQFLQHFIQEGGLIEATPPSDSSTALTVDLVIEPTGDVKVLTTADQVRVMSYMFICQRRLCMCQRRLCMFQRRLCMFQRRLCMF